MSSRSDDWSELLPEPEDSASETSSDRVPSREPDGDDEPQLFLPGERVDARYRVIRTIAHGGMGVVFEVYDEELGIPLALKAVKPHIARQAQTLDRFRREIRLASRVTHPNVCRLYGAGLHRIGGLEVHYLTMELLEGETLSARLRREGPMSPEEAEPIIRQMAAGLAAAHELGIVHRDLKPSNVLLVPGERLPRAVITDFGLSRCLISEEETSRLTATGQLMGTPAYFAPELLEGQRLVAASDIYALGVVVFEILSGELPFTGRSPFVMALRRLNEPPRSIRELVPSLDRRWINWLSYCLQRHPEDRLEDGGAALRMLDSGDLPTPSTPAFGATPSRKATPPPLPTAVPPPPSRRGGALWTGLILLIVIALLAFFFVRRLGPSADAEPILRLAVAAPRVLSPADGVARESGGDLAFELELALRRAANLFEEVRVIDRASSHAIEGSAAELGRATAADVVVTSQLDTAAGQWRVLLERVEMPSRRIAWRHELSVPEATPRLLVHAVDEALARGFVELRRRRTQGALALDSDQYRQLLRLSQGLAEATRIGAGPGGAVDAEAILAALEQLRRQAPNDLEVHLLEARWTLLLSQRTGQSFVAATREAIQRAELLAPGDPRALELAVELALVEGQLDEGWRNLDTLRNRNPEDCDNDRWAARLSEAGGQLDTAAHALRKAVEACPAWDLLAELARIEAAAGRKESARRTLGRALELAPRVGWLSQRLEAFGGSAIDSTLPEAVER